MAQLSVNVNKVATLRNSRGGNDPNLLEAVDVVLATGCTGITVHPRADERHIRRSDVFDLARHLEPLRGRVELNLEGDPRPDFLELVQAVRPAQCTLVPVAPGEITSHAGFAANNAPATLASTIALLRGQGVRVSVFVAADLDAVRWAQSVGADRVELYTEPYARAFESGGSVVAESFALYERAAREAQRVGVGVNAGHDLDLKNLELFRNLPHLLEVSIGHALISHALYVGLRQSVLDYLTAVAARPTSTVSTARGPS